jgi:hypothetical protein
VAQAISGCPGLKDEQDEKRDFITNYQEIISKFILEVDKRNKEPRLKLELELKIGDGILAKLPISQSPLLIFLTNLP